jgi:hypothetical protein
LILSFTQKTFGRKGCFVSSPNDNCISGSALVGWRSRDRAMAHSHMRLCMVHRPQMNF